MSNENYIDLDQFDQTLDELIKGGLIEGRYPLLKQTNPTRIGLTNPFKEGPKIPLRNCEAIWQD